MPFGEWVEFWYENHCKPIVRPGTQRSYEGFISLYIRPKLGSIPLNKLTTNDFQQFFNWMRKDGRTLHGESRGGGLSDNMVHNCHSLCRRVLEKAVAEGLIPQNPALSCKLTPGRRKDMQVLSREEMQRLLIQAKDEGYYEVFLLELTTGLRVGELMALQRHTFATNALEHGIDVKTLSTIIGHVSSATTLNVYAHITDDMKKQAAAIIDRGIGKTEAPAESPQTEVSRSMTDFKAQRGKKRYWGSGFLGQLKGGRWAGRYTVKWPDGRKETRSVYASTEEECEKLLAAMITEMKMEVATEKERLRSESRAG